MRITTSFTLREKVLDELETISQQLNLSRSDIVRLAIEFGLNNDNSHNLNCLPKSFGYVKQKSFIVDKGYVDRLYTKSKMRGESVSALVNLYLYSFLERIDNVAWHLEKAIVGYNDKRTKVIVCLNHLEKNVGKFYRILTRKMKNRSFFFEIYRNEVADERYLVINTRHLRLIVKEFLEKIATV